MGEPSPNSPDRSYGCTWGCGNPYDFIVVTVRDSTTEFLCLPCLVRLASDLVAAVTEPDNPAVIAAVNGAGMAELAPVTDQKVRPRGRNAPATADDPDIIEGYQSVITEDELPEAFR